MRTSQRKCLARFRIRRVTKGTACVGRLGGISTMVPSGTYRASCTAEPRVSMGEEPEEQAILGCVQMKLAPSGGCLAPKVSHLMGPQGVTEADSQGQSLIYLDKKTPFRKTESHSHINFP